MGTDWPTPADLSALDPVCLNKMRGGKFGERMMGLGSVCVQRLLCVCVRGKEMEEQRMTREGDRTGWYC